MQNNTDAEMDDDAEQKIEKDAAYLADLMFHHVEHEWQTTAPPCLDMDGKTYMEAWWAREIFTRLHTILFAVEYFAPEIPPKKHQSFMLGLINIARYGLPEPSPDHMADYPVRLNPISTPSTEPTKR